jgi:hypothetical protein
MIVFLDFDGVMHPTYASEKDYFCQRHLFESTISSYPELRVVISSAWRKDMPLDVLKELFSESIRERIIDITPTIDNEISGYWRYEEIRLWVRLQRFEGSWLAIDDAVHEFPPECKQLIACDIQHGFDAHAAEKLKIAIERNSRDA